MAPGTIAREVEVGGTGIGRLPPGMPPDRGDGGPPPFREPPGPPAFDAGRLGMLIFLGAETMLFAGFVAAYLVFRLGSPVWPPPFQPRLPLGLTGLNTGVLLLSGYTMSRALAALRSGDAWRARRRLGQTALLGAGFLGLQGSEWVRLLHFGLTAASGVYGGTFYVVIGAHAVHALAGLGWVSVLLLTRRFPQLLVAGLYWYFVVALWPILYTLVYLV